MTATVGHAPGLAIQPTEQAKYQEMWDRPEYRAVAPGEQTAHLFLSVACPEPEADLIDFGAGTGRGALWLSNYCQVTALDFADNCLDDRVREAVNGGKLKFVQHDLTREYEGRAKYGYCTDVMEHIPPEQVDEVLKNVLSAARHVFFQISCEDDQMGALIGHPLHLTVQPYGWWKERFEAHHCTIHWSIDAGSHCLFYVTAWAKGEDFFNISVINNDPEQIAENIKANLAMGLQEVRPHDLQDTEMLILAGGPSLNDYVEDIREMRKRMPCVTVNGAYNWALERGIEPGAQIVLDSREFNKRFCEPVRPNCRYLVASQCHPSLVSSLPPEQVWLWHSGNHALLEGRECFPVYGGMTVMLRALPLLRMLGFAKFHIFGFDSCLLGDHHAYEQKENDMKTVVNVTVGGRTFACHPWMLSQAHEFMQLIKHLIGDHCEMAVYGPGLIAHILETGAKLSEIEHGG